MKVAVIGHIEWATFVSVNHVPLAGEIIHSNNSWEEVAGGGSVAAMQLASLADTCMFFTAVGDDEHGKRSIEQLTNNGVEVYASIISKVPTRSIYVDIDAQNERTITVSGDIEPSGEYLSLPWEKLAEANAVYFVSGDKSALSFARAAKVLVSTARVLPLLQDASIQLDALVSSQKDQGEQYKQGDLNPAPNLVVTTNGTAGGSTDSGQKYVAEIVDRTKFVDTYGCGDSFAAGLTLGLGKGLEVLDALNLGSQCGALAAVRRGAFGN